jgi:hypothetical protein
MFNERRTGLQARSNVEWKLRMGDLALFMVLTSGQTTTQATSPLSRLKP